ncbi:hypothetical protein FKM82_024230 [Ascaphus truei]
MKIIIYFASSSRNSAAVQITGHVKPPCVLLQESGDGNPAESHKKAIKARERCSNDLLPAFLNLISVHTAKTSPDQIGKAQSHNAGKITPFTFTSCSAF